jgi:cob(I)alamin adenosyltransferase
MTMKNGLIHIYTGDGKGKTTAAIGLSARALGHAQKVCYCSFHKDPDRYGYTEMQSLKALGATVRNYAKGHPDLNRRLDGETLQTEIQLAIRELSALIASEPFDLLILDEILIAVRDGFLEEETLLAFMREKPVSLELVLTGRGATEKVMALADYVSFVQKVKHPYDQNIPSREGIEF